MKCNLVIIITVKYKTIEGLWDQKMGAICATSATSYASDCNTCNYYLTQISYMN